MSEYILSCCSPADLSKEHFERIGVRYVCFHYFLDGVEYADDLGQTIPFDEFYARMSAGADTRTAQVNVSEYVDFFTPFLEEDENVDVVRHAAIGEDLNAAEELDAHQKVDKPVLLLFVEEERLVRHPRNQVVALASLNDPFPSHDAA